MSTVFVVIPVHNRIGQTLRCLESLSSQICPNATVIVIDDGSTDGTSEKIQTHYPGTVLIKGDGNLWWTGAINLGVLYALKRANNDDYILTLNNDTIVNQDYVSSLLDAAQECPKSLIGSVAVDGQNVTQVIDGGIRINWLTAKFTSLNLGKSYKELFETRSHLQPVDVLPGRGTLIPIEVFHNVGLYDCKRLPHYGSDYEFSIRAKKRGYKLLLSVKSVVGANTKTTGLRNETGAIKWSDLLKSFWSIRSPNNLKSRWHFARTTCPPFLLPTFYLLDTLRVIGGALRNQTRRVEAS